MHNEIFHFYFLFYDVFICSLIVNLLSLTRISACPFTWWKKLSSEILLTRLRQFGNRHADHTKALSNFTFFKTICWFVFSIGIQFISYLLYLDWWPMPMTPTLGFKKTKTFWNYSLFYFIIYLIPWYVISYLKAYFL